MSIQKIFAGPRVKKIRNSIGLSQISMAKELRNFKTGEKNINLKHILYFLSYEKNQ